MMASLAIQNAPSEDSDQTARMRRLIGIFTRRTGTFFSSDGRAQMNVFHTDKCM